jgi:hypothetical protein
MNRRATRSLSTAFASWKIALALALALALAGALAPRPARASELPGYGDDASIGDTRFGARIGAGSGWEPKLAPAPGAALSFGGGRRLGCAGVDFNGFLRSFDPAELLAEMRDSLLHGAQAAAGNYLLTLAYASPTISSVLDMMDKKYSARYSAFALGCNAQHTGVGAGQADARRMAEAADQCFDQEAQRGTAPTEAYRRCSILRSYDALDLPATASTADFLRKYTHVNVTRDVEALLALLPDERIDQGNYQIRPASMTFASMSERLRGQARAALDRVDAGADPASIPACSPDSLLGTAASGDACLPPDAAGLVTSRAFRGARLLGTAARTLFKDALSTQIAGAAMYSNVLELFQQVGRVDVRDGAGADAAHASARRRQLRAAVADLLVEAETQVKAQAARQQLVQSQMLALEQVESDLRARSKAAQAESQAPEFGMRDLLRLFADRDPIEHN